MLLFCCCGHNCTWSPGTACQEWSNSGFSVGVFQHPGWHSKPCLLKHSRIFAACKGAALSRGIRGSWAHTTSAFSWYHGRILFPLKGSWNVRGRDVPGLQQRAAPPGVPERSRSGRSSAGPALLRPGRVLRDARREEGEPFHN